MESTILNNIGVVYGEQGRYTEALTTYQQAMDMMEAVRAMASSEQSRAGFIAQYADLYDRVVTLFHQQDQDEQSFLTAERGRPALSLMGWLPARCN